MIPLQLSIRNFLCYRDNLPPLDLRGVHVACLCGANGHGKSALLDAMTWCLWGQARTGSRNYDALIAYGETECRVELDFQAQGQTYRVIRRRLRSGRGRTELDLFTLNDAGQPRPITGNSLRDTDARIRRLGRYGLRYLCQLRFPAPGALRRIYPQNPRRPQGRPLLNPGPRPLRRPPVRRARYAGPVAAHRCPAPTAR